MKIIHSDFKKGEIKVKIENLDDLWYLKQVIERNDLVKAKTLRKIKLGYEGQRKQKIIKKQVSLIIQVEKVDFGNILRISGVVKQAPEDVPLGSYHTFNIEENSIVTVIKQSWLKFQVEKLKEASKVAAKILICVHDREEAYFALMKKYGYRLLANIKGTPPKKMDIKQTESSFYKEITKQIAEYDKRYGLNKIIIASPAFWKDELMKELTDDNIKRRVILATCSSAGENGINEVLKRPEAKEALKQERIAKEYKYVEELFVEISKNNLGAYGLEETKNAALAGAVRTLLLTDSFIQQKRNENGYWEIDKIMKTAEHANGNILIISSEHEAGRRLNGLGGIGAILRFKMKY